jgi:hypothetical protein
MESVPSISSQSILAFSVPSDDRKQPFTKEMEQATIYCYAELERTKGRGLILKHPTEKTVFVAEVLYPIHLVPWNKLTLIIDGLNTFQHTLTFPTIQSVKDFREKLGRSSETLENHMDFLSENVNYFAATAKPREITLDSLIAEQDLLNELSLYFSTRRRIEDLPSDVVVLSSKVDEIAILNIRQELGNLKNEFQGAAETLYEAMKFLNKRSNSFTKTLHAEIKAIREKYDEEILLAKKAVEPKIEIIQKDYDLQVSITSKKFEKQTLNLNQEKIKFERNKKRAEAKIERGTVEAKASANKRNAANEREWRDAVEEAKKEISRLQSEIKEVDRKLKEVEDLRSTEIFKLRSENEIKITEAKKDLLELENTRDAKIGTLRQKKEKMMESTSMMISTISETAKLRETNLTELEKVGANQIEEEPSLIYVPFYLACYQSEEEKRYVTFPPSTVNTTGLSVKLKGALGQAKIKNLLNPRFESISSLLYGFPRVISQSGVLEREIDEAGVKTNILRKGMRKHIEEGLKQLREEGWLSEKNCETFTQALT